jgi:K+-sensing histidine kinase KdpD
MDLELFKIITEYPFIYEGTLYNAKQLEQNRTCTSQCKEKNCLGLLYDPLINYKYVCSKGYDNILIKLDNTKYILNGLIFKTNASVPKGRKKVRLEWIVNEESILQFKQKVELLHEYSINRTNESTERNFSIFHDFKTSMSIFFNCTQDIINQFPGATFEDKLKQCGKSYQDLFNALELITSQLGMVDVIINPKSITFGNKREINIYKLFHKIKILFGHLTTKMKNINIELINIDGAYIKNSYCYESIEFIPLILLDNALKYSTPDSTVKIEMQQLYNKVKVKVKNIGPLVSDGNEYKIFEKFYRDKTAENYSKEGMGMGLWIAKHILESHDSKLIYHKDQKAVDIGLNIFEFDLHTN